MTSPIPYDLARQLAEAGFPQEAPWDSVMVGPGEACMEPYWAEVLVGPNEACMEPYWPASRELSMLRVPSQSALWAACIEAVPEERRPNINIELGYEPSCLGKSGHPWEVQVYSYDDAPPELYVPCGYFSAPTAEECLARLWLHLRANA